MKAFKSLGLIVLFCLCLNIVFVPIFVFLEHTKDITNIFGITNKIFIAFNFMLVTILYFLISGWVSIELCTYYFNKFMSDEKVV